MSNALAEEIRTEMNQVHSQNSWAIVAGFVQKSPAYAMRVVRGDLRLSDDAMDAWIRNYRQQYAGKTTVRVCPTCGEAHVVGDCHGKDGEPVMKAANEELRPAPLHPIRQRQHRIRREMTPAQATIWDNLSKEKKDKMLGVK